MAKAGYATNTEGAVALAAGTAKSILGVKGHANFGIDLIGFKVSFDGVTASAVPVLVELCYATFATNSPGTASTSTTIDQTYGRTTAAGATAGKTWTTEPTVLTAIDEWLLTPNGGLVMFEYPLGQSPDSAAAEGFVLRLNAPAVVNVRGTMRFERCQSGERVQPTADPDVFIEEQRPADAPAGLAEYVRYVRKSDGRRWEVHGTCDRRGDCLLGAVIEGEVIESKDHLKRLKKKLGKERIDSEMDVPVTPEFKTCCGSDRFSYVELEEP